MPDFKWSPEAIGSAYRVTSSASRRDVEHALNAAVEAQPVVALPPCPTCKGDPDLYAYDAQQDTFMLSGCRCPDGYATCPRRHEHESEHPCPICNGSGVERMVPLSEIVAWLRDRTGQSPYSWSSRVEVAGQIEREFGGRNA